MMKTLRTKHKDSPSKESTHLFLNDSRIDKMENVSSSGSVKVVYLHNNTIKKIENLESMVHLTHLYLQHNKITHIENLDHLRNLKKLYMGYNQIHRLANISHLYRLEELHLEHQTLSGDFTFDAESLMELSKTVKKLNVSGLHLNNLSFLSGFICLEQLIATDNCFGSTSEITQYLGSVPKIIQADFRRSSMQHDFYYRNKISTSSDSLQILDEKPIHHNTKYFLKYLEKKKSKRLALEHLNKQNNANLVMDIKLNDNIEESFNFANIIAEAIAEYKSWNTLKPNQKHVKQSSSGDTLQQKRQNCEEGDDTDAASNLSMYSQKLQLK